MTQRSEDRVYWVAECKYPGKKSFRYYSPVFTWDWRDGTNILDEARERVAAAWSEISPYPAPDVIEVHPGYLDFHPQERPSKA
jgi:hypothetical protein